MSKSHGSTRRTIDRYLSRCGVASREEARRWIAAGRVAVNGRVTERADRWIDPSRDQVTVDGRAVSERHSTQVVIFNKPRGVLVTASDPDGRPVVSDVVPERFRSSALRPVGRLDKASAGLLLLTDDTDLAAKLLDPTSHVEKEYRVKVSPAPSEATLGRWRTGTDIGDATPTAPAVVAIERESERSTVLRFTLTEGRNRQIRRMVAAESGEIEWLVRLRFGPIKLGELEPGEAREVSKSELRQLLDG
ncbi:MAG: pseudouridine synthase [Planctomycetota bacterium]